MYLKSLHKIEYGGSKSGLISIDNAHHKSILDSYTEMYRIIFVRSNRRLAALSSLARGKAFSEKSFSVSEKKTIEDPK